MTGVMSRHVVTIGAIFLIVCGLIPKVGAVIRTIPIEVLGGGVIVMFGMVVAAGVSMLSDVNWNRRNMVIFAIALSLGLGLQLEPGALQYLPQTLKVLATSGILPAAVIAIVLNLVLPEDEAHRLAYLLLPEDRRTLLDNYIHHWGLLFVAGKRLEIERGTFELEILIPGDYTLEGTLRVRIDGRPVDYAPLLDGSPFEEVILSGLRAHVEALKEIVVKIPR